MDINIELSNFECCGNCPYFEPCDMVAICKLYDKPIYVYRQVLPKPSWCKFDRRNAGKPSND